MKKSHFCWLCVIPSIDSLQFLLFLLTLARTFLNAIIIFDMLQSFLKLLTTKFGNFMIYSFFIRLNKTYLTINSFSSAKASGPDCILVVVLKKCKPEFLYILADLFLCVSQNLICLIVGKSHMWSQYLRMLGDIPVFKNVRRYLWLETTALFVFFLLVKSLNCPKKCCLFF